MGIIHHGTYVLLFEEARVALMRHYGVLSLNDTNYPVLELDVKYANPTYFEDEAVIKVTPKIQGARLIFEYEMTTKRFADPVAFGKTVHVAMDMKTRKPIRVPDKIAVLLSQ
jgi:acyl-CoA thioester hydrolase